MKINTQIKTETMHQITLNKADLIGLLQYQYRDVPNHASATVQVPAGGNWLEETICIDDVKGIRVKWTETVNDAHQGGEQTQWGYFAVHRGAAIIKGDLLWRDGHAVKRASMMKDQLTESANQEFFATWFVGVALEDSPQGSTRQIRVGIRGMFTFEYSGYTSDGSFDGSVGHYVGVALRDDTYMGVCENDTGKALLNQSMVPVIKERAIAQFVQLDPAANGMKTVTVKLLDRP